VALGHSHVKKGDSEAQLPVVHILRFDGDHRLLETLQPAGPQELEPKSPRALPAVLGSL